MDGPPHEGAVTVFVVFSFDRPKYHMGMGKNAHLVKESSPARLISKPDEDKMVRAVLDGLTGVVFKDDAQVDIILAYKRYCTPGDPLDPERTTITCLGS